MERGERILKFTVLDGSADGRDVVKGLGLDAGKPSVVAISTSALSSPMSRRTWTPDARRVSPPLLRGCMRSGSFSRAGRRFSGFSACSSSEESDESSNEASTGSMIDRLAFRTSCWADDNELCCVVDGCDRA